ncbi:heavy metal translocating P-type ATPase [Thiohalocapsa marina]|uniref:Heavy metal translocating P-type ATPase n=1 Tax=Thiohalocapsa marina TaxID=424902 RepID=A0A5M8FTD9_9GAMM|nr:heavy metal translocating P-type ATPase [Thiohalocapsa marina]
MDDRVAAAAAETPRCFHCGLPADAAVRESARVAGAERVFCCNGCKSVCQAIHAAGLEGFYRRTPEGEILGPPPEPPKQLALYDLDEVQEEFVDGLGETREINLLVEGIHCAACVWLIENGLAAMPGVEEARVNLTGRRLRLKWDNRRLKLSRVLRRLAEIGYAAVPFDPDAAEGSLKRENRALLYRMAFAGFGMMNLMWISIALYAGADQGEFRDLFHWIGFVIATPVLLYSGWPFYRGAWLGLRRLRLGMDLPIAIGASITYLYSLYVTVSGSGHVYWDTVVNFMFVILVGRYLEAISKRQAVSSTQRLLDLQPKVATVLRDGEEAVVPIRAVVQDDEILVRPGETIPADGVVVEGLSQVDEAMLTGESTPVARGQGDAVCAGTLNGAGVLRVRVSGVLRDSALGRIIRLVEDAQASKSPIQCMADRIVPWFVAVTLLLATLTFFWWLRQDVETALTAATAVLIITCPCAFGLATPMAIAVATGLGARQGILVKDGAVLEALSGIGHYVFDKTGTVTEGRPRVTRIRDAGGVWLSAHGVEALDAGRRRRLQQLAALERLSEHPLGRAVTDLADEAGLPAGRLQVSDVEVVPGQGIAGCVDGSQVVIGNADWLRRFGVALASWPDGSAEEASGKDLAAESLAGDLGGTLVHAAVDGVEVMQLLAADRLRADAAEVVRQLRADGLRVTLLTGDRQTAAERIAAQLGDVDLIAEVLPEDKDRVIAGLQAGGQRVAMIGDGVNDAPALVRADVGIAVGSGTDVSIASADLVLMSDELTRVGDAGRLARRTLRTIRQNIGLSVVYNIIMVPLAMGAMITPLVAAISMPLSSLAVIGNSARIRGLFRSGR